MIRSVLITGCNRGLGLGLVKHLVNIPNPPVTLISTCRNLEKAKELREIAEKHKNVHILLLDVKNFEGYDDFAKQVKDIVGDNGLNVLFNNAGTSPKSTKLHLVKPDQLIDTYITNTVAPVMLTKSLVPLLKAAAEKNSDKHLSSQRAAVVNMSSILGSITENNTEGLYPYKCSKAGINMATKTLGNELRKDGIMSTCIHPGWVRTDMGGPKAPLDIETSVKGIVDFLYSLNEQHNGGYFQYDGKKLPW